MNLGQALLKGTIFEKKIPVDGVVARIGTRQRDDGAHVSFTLEGAPGAVYSHPCRGGSDELLLMSVGDRVRFIWHTASLKMTEFENATRRSEVASSRAPSPR